MPKSQTKQYLIDAEMVSELIQYIKDGERAAALEVLKVFTDRVADEEAVKQNFGGYFCAFQDGNPKPIAFFDRAYFLRMFLKSLGDGFNDGDCVKLGEWLEKVNSSKEAINV